MVSRADAHALAGTAGSGPAQGGGWHVREVQDGIVLVCMESLLKSM